MQKKTFHGNAQKPKPQSSHLIFNEQNPNELNETRNDQKVNKQIDGDFVVKTEYSDDECDDQDEKVTSYMWL